MADPDGPTGNPVFDYRAGFRARARKLQHVLISAGLALFSFCGGAFLFGDITERLRCIAGWVSLAGIMLCVLGVVWGIYWRKKLRAEFSKVYGPSQDH